VVVLCCAATYRCVEAGLFFMTPVLLSNTLTFSFMSAVGIGMNLNTVPVAALGIGLGVDYSFYIVDRIREELQLGHSLETAIRESLRTSGWAVMVTAATLSISVLIWNFSTLKFQAEMGLLIGVWLFISAMSAVILMPTMVYVLRPKFVVGTAGLQVINNA
jgi:predicted RND superfamily exporter protein